MATEEEEEEITTVDNMDRIISNMVLRCAGSNYSDYQICYRRRQARVWRRR